MLAERVKEWTYEWERKGIEKGRFEGTLAVARNLLPRFSDEEIVEITGLQLPMIQQLRREMKIG